MSKADATTVRRHWCLALVVHAFYPSTWEKRRHWSPIPQKAKRYQNREKGSIWVILQVWRSKYSRLYCPVAVKNSTHNPNKIMRTDPLWKAIPRDHQSKGKQQVPRRREQDTDVKPAVPFVSHQVLTAQVRTCSWVNLLTWIALRSLLCPALHLAGGGAGTGHRTHPALGLAGCSH